MMGLTWTLQTHGGKGSNPGLWIEPVSGQGVPDQGNSFYKAPEEEIHRTFQIPPRNSGGADISARPRHEERRDRDQRLVRNAEGSRFEVWKWNDQSCISDKLFRLLSGK